MFKYEKLPHWRMEQQVIRVRIHIFKDGKLKSGRDD
jgi:hypothetical protein